MRKTTKIVVSLLLTLCMLLPMSTMLVVSAEPEQQTTTSDVSYYTGNATAISAAKTAILEAFNAGKPIEIDSADALVAFAQQSAATTFKNATVNITTDIVINKGNAASWIYTAPAFAWPGITNFSGTFNGNGHTISGVYMKDTAIGKGFFNQLNQAATTINDLGFVNSLFLSVGASYTPSIVGRANSHNLTFNRCYSNAITITDGGVSAGGFVTLTTNSVTTFNDCVFDGIVKSTGTTAVGGFVGRAGYYYGQGKAGAKYENCVNRGYVVSTDANKMGGFSGEASYFELINCANVGLGATALVGRIPTATKDANNGNTNLPELDVAITNCYYSNTPFVVAANNTTYANITTGSGSSTAWTLPTLNSNLTDDLNYVPVANKTAVDGYNAHAFTLKYVKEYVNKTVTKDFSIGSGDEFYALGAMLNITGLANPNITLTNNIVLNEGDAEDWASNPPAYKWGTIGAPNGSKFYFTGTLDGNGKTISGLYLNQENGGSDQAVGLFAVLGANATVKNLAIVNSYVNNARVYAGTIAGRVNGDKASISNCYVDAIVSDQNGSGDGAGIFVGFCSNTNFTITGSVAAGTVKSGDGAGGFIGMNPSYNANSLNWNPAITDCVNLATVTGGSAGAFIGRDLNATITRCINLGLTMSGNYATNALIGGVTATNAAATKSVVTITDSYIFTDFNQAALGRIYQSGTVAIPTTDHDLSVTTIAKLSSIKGTAASEVLTALDFAGKYSNNTDWVTRTGDYPLPKYIAETFAGVLCDTNALVNESLAKIKYLNAYEGGVREFEIASEDDLIMVAELLNGGSFANNGLGVTFKLTDNIVFNEGWNAATKTAPEYAWTPIANFRGTLDGDGHTISGLYINNTGSYVGFINVALESACVEDLAIVNSYYVNTSSSGYMGGIFGRINAKNVSVIGCYSDAIMTGAARIGGFVGLVTNTVAQTNGDPETAAKLTACVFDGTITSSGGHVGGIVATTGVYDGTNAEKTGAWHNITFVDCANYGTVEYTSTGTISTGAIIGWIQGANNVSLTRCLNFGDVKTNSTSTDTRDGALVGRIQNNSNYGITITDSYIFTDLGQKYLFDNASIDWCNQPSYTINGVSNVSSTVGKTDNPAADHIQAIIANSSLYTIADSNTLKTKLLEGYDNWTLRNYYSKDLQYPMPTRVYENFFKSQLVGYQATPVKKMGVVKSYTLRLIAELDSTNYYNAGFTIKATINGVTKTMTVTTDMVDANGNKYVGVYNTITSNTGETYTAREGNCLITITITELPTSAAEFEVTVFTNGATDDSRSASTTQTVNFNSSYEVVEN